MRYSASEKLEIIRTVEKSHLPVKQTLDMLGFSRTTFYRWYDLYTEGGLEPCVRPELICCSPKAFLNFTVDHTSSQKTIISMVYTLGQL